MQHFTVFYSILNKSVIHQLCHSMLILTRKTPSTIISLLYWFHWANNCKLQYKTNLCIFCSILQYFTVLWKEILVQNNTFWKYTYQRCNFCKKTFCCKYLWWYPYMGSWLFPYNAKFRELYNTALMFMARKRPLSSPLKSILFFTEKKR